MLLLCRRYETSLHNFTCQEIIALSLPLESPKILVLNLCVEWNHDRDQGRLPSLAEFTQLEKLGVTSKFRGVEGVPTSGCKTAWKATGRSFPDSTRFPPRDTYLNTSELAVTRYPQILFPFPTQAVVTQHRFCMLDIVRHKKSRGFFDDSQLERFFI